MKRVPPYGPTNAKLAIVGIAPGKDEVYLGRPFVGPSGRILSTDLADAGVSLDACYRTNIFKVQLPDNDFKRHKELGLDLDEAISEVNYELSQIQPNCILGLGAPVLFALYGKEGKHNGIHQWRGSILPVGGRKAVFTWHPAAQLHGQGAGGQKKETFQPWQQFVRKFDIQRAVNQSKFKEYNPPVRLLQVCSDSAHLYRFLERNANKQLCAVDIEAIQNIPVCIGLSFTKHEAISIPLWNLLHVQHDGESPKSKKNYNYDLHVSSIPNADLAVIWQLLARLFQDRNKLFIGQNFKYDEDKLNRLGFYLHSLYSDILIRQHFISSELPRSLAFQTSIYTEEPYYKDEGREYNPAKDKIRDLLLYNCKDAACTLEIHEAQEADIGELKPDGLEFRMRLHKFYHRMEQVGFKVDEEQRTKLIHKYVEILVNLEKEFHELTQTYGVDDPINVNSPIQLAVLFYKTMGIPERKGTGEEVLTALAANTVKKPDQLRAIDIVLQYRKVAKTLGTYLAAETDYDGRLKTTYFITGTESFRSSTQILKPPIRDREIGWAIQTVTKHGDTGNDLRSILVADRGYIFVNIDQSQAEARVCSLLADDEETLRLYDTNDIHALTASKVFGGTEQTWSKKVLGYECPERFCGKTARHAYHLDIGKHELMINMNTDAKKYKIPLNISEWKAGEILKALRAMTPKIANVYHKTIEDLLRKDRRLFGTFGASFYLYEEWGRDLFKAAYSRIPQQTVSDKTKSVGIWIQATIWDCLVVGEAHDALLLLCPERKLDDYIPRIREEFHKPISFSDCSIPRRDLVIPTDCEVGYDYEDLRKWRGKESMTLNALANTNTRLVQRAI